jgi:hypothetical protein
MGEPYKESKVLGDGNTQIDTGMLVKGVKVPLAKTTCRPDGIFVEKILFTPGPDKSKPPVQVKINQANIVVGELPADTFTVPDGLKSVAPRK